MSEHQTTAGRDPKFLPDAEFYHCDQCRRVLTAAEVVVSRDGENFEFGGSTLTHFTSICVCTTCGDEVLPCTPCQDCKQNRPLLGSDYCLECYERNA